MPFYSTPSCLSRISSSFPELKGHEHVTEAVTVGINTCLYIFDLRLHLDTVHSFKVLNKNIFPLKMV